VRSLSRCRKYQSLSRPLPKVKRILAASRWLCDSWAERLSARLISPQASLLGCPPIGLSTERILRGTQIEGTPYILGLSAEVLRPQYGKIGAKLLVLKRATHWELVAATLLSQAKWRDTSYRSGDFGQLAAPSAVARIPVSRTDFHPAPEQPRLPRGCSSRSEYSTDDSAGTSAHS